MKFLSKLGQILLKGTKIITGLEPLFPAQAGVIAKAQDTITKLSELVVIAEGMGAALNLPGPDKLRAIVPYAKQIVLNTDLFLKKKINDINLFNAGLEKVMSGLADMLNAVNDDIDTKDIG